jgi:hypothetical protein
MAAFLGAQTSLRDGEYTDLRSKTSEEPYAYLSRFTPSGTCPQENPLTCTFSEGGQNLSTPEMRLGKGLSRTRGNRVSGGQLVGPGSFQCGNGDIAYAKVGTKLRNGHSRQVMRGRAKPFGELKTHAGFQQGQTPWTTFESTAERGRNKYQYATACTSMYATTLGPCRELPVETFRLGGVSTRNAKDFHC